MKKLGVTLLVLLVACLLLGIDFIVTMGAVKFVCWCFGWNFSWKIAIGIWVLILILAPKPNQKIN